MALWTIRENDIKILFTVWALRKLLSATTKLASYNVGLLKNFAWSFGNFKRK